MKRWLLSSAARFGGLCLFSASVFATSYEVLDNGDFSQVLHGWWMSPALGGVAPFLPGENAVETAPWVGMDEFPDGPLLAQPLNLDLQPGDLLQVGLDARRMFASWPTFGMSAGVALELMDGSGQRYWERVLEIDNSELVDADWQRFTATYEVPGDRVRLVGFVIEKLGHGSLYVRGASLEAPRAGGQRAQLQTVAPAAAHYGEPVVLTGTGFGSAQGRVLVGGATAGVGIQSWTDTRVEITLAPPSTGGEVQVESLAGVRSWQSRHLRLASPHFRIEVRPVAEMHGPGGAVVETLPGRPADVAVFVRFFNGYAPEGGVVLTAGGAGGADMSFSINPVPGPGGAVARVETTGWEPGLHEVTVRGTTGDDLEAMATTQIRVVDPSGLVWATNTGPLNGAEFDRQGVYDLYPELFDEMGHHVWIHPMADAITVLSSNPAVLQVHNDPSLFGGFSILVHDSGEATVTTILPDGSSFESTVVVDLPSEPRITGSGFEKPVMTNFPGQDTGENRNQFFFSATSSFSSVSVSWGAELESDGFSGSGASRAWAFYAGEHLEPGSYVVSGGGTADGVRLSTGRILQVVNDPATGLVRGRMVALGGAGHGHGIYGIVEFYDAATEDLVHQVEVWGGDGFGGYVASRVPPGTYKLRWTGFEWDGPNAPSKWFPNADGFADAVAVEVAAGAELANVDFLMVPPAPDFAPLALRSAPVADRAAGIFSMAIVAEDNVEYALQKSLTMGDNTWVTVATGWAWDGQLELEDPDYTEDVAFYRILRLD